MSHFSIIYAVGRNGEFGYKNSLPWPSIKEDMENFQQITDKNIIIMGRCTYESIGKPLPNRTTIVITKTKEIVNGILYAENLDAALELSKKIIMKGEAKNTFVIGGVSLIKEAMCKKELEYVYRTLVIGKQCFQADKYIYDDFELKLFTLLENRCLNTSNIFCRQNNIVIHLEKYIHKDSDHPENSYLELASKIITKGVKSSNRTGIDTLSLWGEKLEIDMSKGFPLLTSKKVYFKGVAVELLWFLSGKTDTTILEKQGVNIWKPNTSRDFLNKRGLTGYKEGELGPGYGFQWRHFGAKYIPNKQLEIGEEGVDQILWVINAINIVKNDPSNELSRRLLVNTWNPLDLNKMALVPCHYSFQFQVRDGFLNCLVTLRSNDFFLGDPFNIASYSLLCYMIGYLTGLKPGKLVFSIADAHIYSNHIEQVKEQLSRPMRKWPTLEIVGSPANIDSFTMDNFKIVDYFPHTAITAVMAV